MVKRLWRWLVNHQHFKGEEWVAWVGGLLLALMTLHWDWYGLRGGAWALLLVSPLYILPGLSSRLERLSLSLAWGISVAGIIVGFGAEHASGVSPAWVAAFYLTALVLSACVGLLHWKQGRVAR